MRKFPVRTLTVCVAAGAIFSSGATPLWAACSLERCPTPALSEGDATLEFSGASAGALVPGDAKEAADYIWRLRDPCVISDELDGACSAIDFRDCPQEPGRVIEFLRVERRAVVRPDGTSAEGSVPEGFQPGDPVGD